MSNISSFLKQPIEYSTNKEYRQVLREFCNMKCIDIYENTDIDDESRDELLFDINSTKDKMDEIYNTTKYHPLWIKIYEKAAAKFFSIEPEIGISILLCYDYFPFFYDCWILFINNPNDFTETNEVYQKLFLSL